MRESWQDQPGPGEDYEDIPVNRVSLNNYSKLCHCESYPDRPQRSSGGVLAPDIGRDQLDPLLATVGRGMSVWCVSIVRSHAAHLTLKSLTGPVLKSSSWSPLEVCFSVPEIQPYCACCLDKILVIDTKSTALGARRSTPNAQRLVIGLVQSVIGRLGAGRLEGSAGRF